MAPVPSTRSFRAMTVRSLSPWLAVPLVAAVLSFSTTAQAEDPMEGMEGMQDTQEEKFERSDGWNRATNIMAFSSAALQVLMPRVFYSDPEVTVGWKAR